MRARSILLVVAILLVAGFAALNWSEIVRPSPLLFGPMVMDAPMGLILLALLALTLVLFLASSVAMRTQSLLDYRQHQKTLEAQRELAEKAERSRFEELRARMDEHLRAVGERDTLAANEQDKALVLVRRDMQAHMEQMNRMMSARLNELEHRLETRFERMGLPGRPMAPMAEPSVRSEAAQEHAMAREVRAEERAEQREVRAEEKAMERPPETGWRRWF